MADEVHTTLKHMLEQSKSDMAEEDQNIFKMIKHAYTACMDKETIQNAGLDPLKELVKTMKEHIPLGRAATFDHDYSLQLPTIKHTSSADWLSDAITDATKLNVKALVAFRVGVRGTFILARYH
jgi:Peptidase family M13